MIQANVSAAETLEKRRQRLLYRIHDAPSLAKLESLREFLHTMNLSMARAGNLRAAHFNRVLDAVAESDREELVSQAVLRSQSQAEYSPDNIGHFGLNLMRYAHFTSPIRRYADLIVHRALIGALKLGEGGITAAEEERLDVVGADISMAERRAMQAERDTVDRLIAIHLSERVGERFMGRITGVTKAGLFVTLAETGADGFIPISMVADDYFRYDEANYALVGSASGEVYQMGQTVEVRLAEAQPMAGALRFDMLSKGRKSSGLLRAPGERVRKPAAGTGASAVARTDPAPAAEGKGSDDARQRRDGGLRGGNPSTGAAVRAFAAARRQGHLPFLRRRQAVCALSQRLRAVPIVRRGTASSSRRRSAGLPEHPLHGSRRGRLHAGAAGAGTDVHVDTGRIDRGLGNRRGLRPHAAAEGRRRRRAMGVAHAWVRRPR